jgi:diguanylate cyclase (GGDEF)-like protein
MTPIIFLSARDETRDKVRAFRIGAQDYVVKPFNSTELLLRVNNAIDRRDRELGASPTTRLPGAEAIENEIRGRLEAGGDAVFCYLDLDHLKAFNDYYGYAKADAVIRQTGNLIRQIVAEHGTAADFIGHIAGDDFVFVTSEETADSVCTGLCERFDQLIPYYYRSADRERGHIRATDRYGEEREFPIMRVSIAAVSRGELRRYSDVAAAAAAGKSLAKSQAASSYVRDGKLIVPS